MALERNSAALEGPEGLDQSSGERGVVAFVDEEEARLEEETARQGYWVGIAKDCHTASADYFDQSIRRQMERAYALFNSAHPPGSPYLTKAYEKRSRHFRPKTRASLRRLEAAVAVAFFSTQDVVHCSATDDGDPMQVFAAEVHHLLLNEYLTDPKLLPWYLTVIGAAQDTFITGVCISRQDWRYRQEQMPIEIGGELQRIPVIVEDRPDVTLIPVENFRFDPAADWRDPVRTSPYLIELIPLYVKDIRRRAESGFYRSVPEGVLMAASADDWDSVRKYREGNRVDKYEQPGASVPSEYRVLWVHRNIVQHEGSDWVFDTLKDEFLLSDPVPLERLYPHGERPYVLGVSTVEAHKNHPTSVALLGGHLQEEINDLANLRIDNIRLALNKRYYIRRGAGVDLGALVRNVPGGGVLMNDPNSDVKEVSTQDVTRSSFEEYQTLSTEYDDVAGNFSTSSVLNNRALNETVGGMNILSSDASQVQEFSIRTFAETWVEPVLRQLVTLLSIYETDEDRLARIAGRLGASVEQVVAALSEEVVVRVNVGFNSTNPQKRLERVLMGMNAIGQLKPELMMDLDGAEVVKEIFGALGFRDGKRFFPSLSGDVDPQVAALQQQVDQLMQVLQSEQFKLESQERIAQVRAQATVAVAQIRAQVEVAKLESGGQREVYIAALKNRLEEYDRMLATEENDRKRQELFLQREALSHTILKEDREYNLKLMQIRRSNEREDMSTDLGDGAKNLPGKDKAGIISRERYGMLPDSSL